MIVSVMFEPTVKKKPESRATPITGCAVAQHCCNDDQQSQWEIGDFDPL